MQNLLRLGFVVFVLPALLGIVAHILIIYHFNPFWSAFVIYMFGVIVGRLLDFLLHK